MEIRSFHNWFSLSKEGQFFTWKDWRGVMNHKMKYPISFLAKLWSLIMNIVENERMGFQNPGISIGTLKKPKLNKIKGKGEKKYCFFF